MNVGTTVSSSDGPLAVVLRSLPVGVNGKTVATAGATVAALFIVLRHLSSKRKGRKRAERESPFVSDHTKIARSITEDKSAFGGSVPEYDVVIVGGGEYFSFKRRDAVRAHILFHNPNC